MVLSFPSLPGQQPLPRLSPISGTQMWQLAPSGVIFVTLESPTTIANGSEIAYEKSPVSPGCPHARAPYLSVKTSSIQSTCFPAEVMQVPFLFSWMTNKVSTPGRTGSLHEVRLQQMRLSLLCNHDTSWLIPLKSVSTTHPESTLPIC